MAKIAVITGAGAGVGRAAVTEFAKAGYDVALLSRDPDRLERAAYETRRHGVRALPIPTDVADAAPSRRRRSGLRRSSARSTSGSTSPSRRSSRPSTS